MKTAVQMLIVLTLVTTISGGLLAAFDSYTSPYIEANRLKVLKSAISEVLPEYDYYKEIKSGENTVYAGMVESVDQPVGLAFRVVGNGFQGKIAMMVGIYPDFATLTGIKILEQLETPGLGTKIEDDPSRISNRYWFTKQFKGLDPWPLVKMVKNQKPTATNEIEAITGATISSQSVVRILNGQIKEFRKIYQEQEPSIDP